MSDKKLLCKILVFSCETVFPQIRVFVSEKSFIRQIFEERNTKMQKNPENWEKMKKLEEHS